MSGRQYHPVMSSRIAVVTGASTGIGRALAVRLVREGFEPLLLARRADKLAETAAAVKAANGTAHLGTLDVTKPGAADEALKLAGKHGTPEVLVNNAGFGIYGPFREHDRAETARMIDTNVRALTDFTAAFLPGMLERKSGRILQIASSAAFQAMPYNAAYSATKAYVLLFGEGLAVELKGTGVSCTTLCPGPTESEFFAQGQYDKIGGVPKMVFMSAERVADIGVRAMMRRRPVVVAGVSNKLGAFAAQLVPRRATAGMLGLVLKPRKR